MSDKRITMLCADLHGQLKWLAHHLVDELNVEHVDIIVLGDFGVGFIDLEADYNHIKRKLEKNDINIYALRGNHDNPKYFQSEEEYSKPRLTFMEDYKIYEINGYTILPIGGAVSTDRLHRIPWKTWWADEDIKRVPKKSLPIKVDMILSHEGPSVFEPVLSKFEDLPDEDYEKIVASRKYLDEILFNVKSDYWFYGHHHRSYSGQFKNCSWRCLRIGVTHRSKLHELEPEIIDDMFFPKKDSNPQSNADYQD